MLEISARQTGKTSRLAHEARFAVNMNPAILVVASIFRKKNAMSSYPHIQQVITCDELTREYQPNSYRYFYDDFDEYLNKIPEFRDIDHYATTPMKMRVLPDQLEDRLFELIKVHNGRFISHINTDKELILKMAKLLPYDAFRREVLGQFCEPFPLNI